MILDERTEFADAVSVGTPNSSTVNVGDIIDSSVVRDLGGGHQLYLVVQITTTVVGANSTTRFILASDSTDTIATDGTQSIHGKTDEFTPAQLVAGFQVAIPLPPEGSNAYERYLAFQIEETAGNALSAGNVNAFLTFDPPVKWKSYADGDN